MKTTEQETNLSKVKRNKYSPQFKEQALERAKRDGVPKAAKDLGIAATMLYNWQTKSRQTGQPFEDQKLQQAELARLKREVTRLEDEVSFLKKAGGVLCQTTAVKYAMIHSLEAEFAVALMCRLLSLSRSGYYQWKKRPPSRRQQAREALAGEIKRVFDDEKGRAGSIRIAKRLNEEGYPTSRHSVAKIMKTQGWRAKAAKKYKATTNSNHNLPVAPNLLEQDFYAPARNQKWVSDITYIWTDEGWLYLAVVLELFSRKVLGWAIAERMTATLVCDALTMALWRRHLPKGVIVHSDRGSQYCSNAYQALLAKHQLICSMSKKGDCYDNAAMESWNHSFKVEAIHGERFPTRGDAKQHVFDYIEVYYNRKRLHSKLGYLSPEAFELKNVA
ncbi:IS3 family transposase [Candidatus Methylospira mobilis]|uniref:IS3 family transposase n=1 Tax=Candidatus Methylospira mobilis TaxID=1808979 RepID=UPI0028E75320|nr:IS3 family transposase [Candidatus Methylospira mobilis]WNV04494.1 IS3 family transposase [Candidatus Methylospira mobilis]